MSVGKRIYLQREMPDPEIVEQFKSIPASNTADVMGRSCAMNPRIHLVSKPKAQMMAGPAYTVKCRAGDNLTLHAALNFCQEGDVLVVDETGKNYSGTGVDPNITGTFSTEYASGERHAGGYILYGTDAEGAEKNKVVQVSGGDNAMLTVDVSYSRVCSLLEVDALQNYKVNFNGGTLEFLVDPTHYGQLWQFRFKNVYDMPEVLTATGGLTVSAADESDTALMWGVERKFGVKVTDEYTANSGVILLQSDYRLWRDMLHAQEVQVKAGENWLPIVITNMKYDRDFRRSTLKTVEFSFRLADDTQSNLMDV